MKIKLVRNLTVRWFLGITLVGSTAICNGQLPIGSSLTILPGSGSTAVNVTINDPANHVWLLQGSQDLNTWSEIEAIKLHNGVFHRSLPSDPLHPTVFYRSVYDPTRQNISSTLTTALQLPETAFNYAALNLPQYLLAPVITAQDNTPANNPVTDAGATLGRALFYDKRLSTNQTVSCSSCHQASHGFSDSKKFSVGFNGGLTGRNSMGLSSARYYQRKAFFWDERAATLEDQVLQPIQNAVEMGMTLTALVDRLAAEPYYTNLFKAAFGTTNVTSDRISKSLAQFVRSMVSTKSKYDQGIPIGFSNFTTEENLGRQIFFGQVGNASCSACHGTDNFVPGPNINNNGLENPYVDKGVGALTGLPQDEGLFKVPSLRNIALTAPYMHDGRFTTLEEVVEFYNSGVVAHPNLSAPLRNPPGSPNQGAPRRLNLTTAQKAALVAFLKTLTDTTLTSDPKFQDPFNYGD